MNQAKLVTVGGGPSASLAQLSITMAAGSVSVASDIMSTCEQQQAAN